MLVNGSGICSHHGSYGECEREVKDESRYCASTTGSNHELWNFANRLGRQDFTSALIITQQRRIRAIEKYLSNLGITAHHTRLFFMR
ncbi:Uncharacterized protein HZ326_4633 [Fusarium oxysporum f. sp. albedinis]|nr:Uncharacterized protein HZ326_4633 [Fusarium oxysporum f. sp. albedinis]